MKGLAELIISFFDLLEAEGQLLRHNALRTLRTAMLLGLGLLFGAAALAFFVAALYKALSIVLHPAWVLCIIGIVFNALGLIMEATGSGISASTLIGTLFVVVLFILANNIKKQA